MGEMYRATGEEELEFFPDQGDLENTDEGIHEVVSLYLSKYYEAGYALTFSCKIERAATEDQWFDDAPQLRWTVHNPRVNLSYFMGSETIVPRITIMKRWVIQLNIKKDDIELFMKEGLKKQVLSHFKGVQDER